MNKTQLQSELNKQLRIKQEADKRMIELQEELNNLLKVKNG